MVLGLGRGPGDAASGRFGPGPFGHAGLRSFGPHGPCRSESGGVSDSDTPPDHPGSANLKRGILVSRRGLLLGEPGPPYGSLVD